MSLEMEINEEKYKKKYLKYKAKYLELKKYQQEGGLLGFDIGINTTSGDAYIFASPANINKLKAEFDAKKITSLETISNLLHQEAYIIFTGTKEVK
jgi:hypothetical protein